MFSRRLVSSPLLPRLLRLTQNVPCNNRQPLAICPTACFLPSSTCPTRRFFADDNKNGDNVPEDPFGVNYEDGDDKLGPSSDLPPEYKRDAATGKLTGDIVIQLTDEERKLLRADPLQREKLLLKRIVTSWKEQQSADDNDDALPLNEFARRVRFTNMNLNVLGRSVPAQESSTILDNGVKLGKDEHGFTSPLSPQEMETFQTYMEKEHNIQVDEDDMFAQPPSSTPSSKKKTRRMSKMEDIVVQKNTGGDDIEDADNPDLSLKWMTKRAQWEMTKTGYDGPGENDPFADILPGELKPTRLVNRKKAKLLPRELLHHNNLSLLRRYINPTGQIMNRVHSRLGAKDQRKVAKMIKRARNLGLIPTQGQFVVEEHGDIYEDDIETNLWWEDELVERGLVVDVSKRPDTKKYFDNIRYIEEELARRGMLSTDGGEGGGDTATTTSKK